VKNRTLQITIHNSTLSCTSSAEGVEGCDLGKGREGKEAMPTKALSSMADGFRTWLEKAVRVEEEEEANGSSNNNNNISNLLDWGAHTVDYGRFKQRLKYFARRRSQLRNMVRNSPDQRISDEILVDMLGPKTPFPLRRRQPKIDAPASSPPLVAGDRRRGNAANEEETSTFPPTEVNVPSGECYYRSMQDDDVNDDAEAAQPSKSSTDIDLDDLDDLSQSSSAAEGGKQPGRFGGKQQQTGKRRDQRYVLRRISVAERNEIMMALDDEMDKVLMFYLSQWQKLSLRLERLQQQRQYRHPDLLGDNETTGSDGANNANAAVADSNDGRREDDLGDEILELIAFCVINVVTAQQVLIRYDAFARAFEGTPPILNYYMKKVLLKHQGSFRKLLFHGELQAIADSYVETASLDAEALDSFQAQRGMFVDILQSLQSTETLAKRESLSCSDGSSLENWERWLLQGLFEDRLGLEPAYLTGRGQSLQSEMERLAMWRKKKSDVAQQQSRIRHAEQKLSGMQVFNLTLNLLSAFLYCMNYYIVEPSSTMYVNRLGAHDALSGTLIGMLPLAAFVSSIPYSMWTNRSFRHPFLMSCLMLILGNLMYSIADQFQQVWIALLGRFICGLGAPKCIIRRYMADTTPVSLRTSVNAGFGMVVAAGSAMGPAMAIVLNKIEYTTYVHGLGIVTLNGLTLPGYFMACLWLTFGVIVLLTFEEPDRQGLKEQQVLEARGAVPSSPSNVSASDAPLKTDEGSIFSGESSCASQTMDHHARNYEDSNLPKWMIRIRKFLDLITLPVRICLCLLFCKVFTIESLVSATSALSKNRYRWQVQQVGMLGLTNGLLVIPFSILVGRLSMSYQDQVLMKWLVGIGCFGMFLLIDLSDLVGTPTSSFNKGHVLAVSPPRYVTGYFISYISIQAFEGVIGSTLSKVIPTALASGTFNSGLLATLVDTFGRACGDLFISGAGFVCLRQLMNLLFVPGFLILLTCFIVIERSRDMLSV
jgi:Major Facilitator Superfamily